MIGDIPSGEGEGTLPELLGIFTNYSTPVDVDFDEFVSPLDALLIINLLNLSLQDQVEKLLSDEELYYEVNDDLEISVHDIALAEFAIDLDLEMSWNPKRNRRYAINERVRQG